MREILFRGKRLDNGEWVEGDICHHDGVVSHIGQHPADGSMVCYDLDPATVCQFTGLLDKNGKRIFEGDICRVSNLMYKVEFKYSAWWFAILSNKVYCCPAFNSHCGEYCEVIGNIHDNPELLEVTPDE